MLEEKKNKKFYIETYGCQMNLSDSELMAGILIHHGYQKADSLDNAGIILVNTCAVREHAESRVLGHLTALNRYKQRRPDLILGVCGCMAQHLKQKIIETVPYVDIVMGPDSYRNLPAAIKNAMSTSPFLDLKLDKKEHYADIEPFREEGIRAWLPIMRGCNKMCTFCIVPFVRGRERSLPLPALIDEVKKMADEGYKEVILLGQTVNSYHHDGYDFSDLLMAVSEVENIERIRFTSPHPIDVTDKMIATMAKLCEKVNYIL